MLVAEKITLRDKIWRNYIYEKETILIQLLTFEHFFLMFILIIINIVSMSWNLVKCTQLVLIEYKLNITIPEENQIRFRYHEQNRCNHFVFITCKIEYQNNVLSSFILWKHRINIIILISKHCWCFFNRVVVIAGLDWSCSGSVQYFLIVQKNGFLIQFTV